MSLRMAKSWQCDVFPDRVRLRDGKRTINEISLLAEETLVDVLTRLFRTRPPAFAWVDSVKFWLDNSLTHTLTVPWLEGIATPDELRGYTLSLAQQTFPHLVSQSLRIDFEHLEFGSTALAVTLEEKLWQTLHAVTRSQKLRFKGVVTPFQYLLNSQRQSLPASGIFVVSGEETSTFACRTMHQWQHVHRMAFPDFSLQQQLELIKRLSGLKDAPCYYLDTLNWQVSQFMEDKCLSSAAV